MRFTAEPHYDGDQTTGFFGIACWSPQDGETIFDLDWVIDRCLTPAQAERVVAWACTRFETCRNSDFAGAGFDELDEFVLRVIADDQAAADAIALADGHPYRTDVEVLLEGDVEYRCTWYYDVQPTMPMTCLSLVDRFPGRLIRRATAQTCCLA